MPAHTCNLFIFTGVDRVSHELGYEPVEKISERAEKNTSASRSASKPKEKTGLRQLSTSLWEWLSIHGLHREEGMISLSTTNDAVRRNQKVYKIQIINHQGRECHCHNHHAAKSHILVCSCPPAGIRLPAGTDLTKSRCGRTPNTQTPTHATQKHSVLVYNFVEEGG